MAFTAVGALIAGEAVTATLVLAAVTEVGLAMTVVGAVTGSKSLMKIGGVLSLVGGVGGLINGAMSGVAAGAESLASADIAGGLIPEYGTTAAYNAGLGDLSGLGESLASSGFDVGMSGFEGADLGALADEALTELGSLGETVSESPGFLKEMGAAPEPNGLDITPNPMEAAPSSPTVSQAAAEPFKGADASSLNVDAGNKAFTPTTGSQMPSVQSKTFFADFMGWVKKNKEIVGGVMKGIAEAPLNDAKEEALRQQAAESRARYQYGNTVARVKPLIGGV